MIIILGALRLFLSKPAKLPVTLGISMIKYLKSMISKFSKNRGDKVPIVTWDEKKVICSFPDGLVKSMQWDDLKAVVIETTDEGPWMEDVYFILFSNEIESSFEFPQCSKGSQELLERLMKLPRFDENAVIKAMGCTSNNSFLCWEKPGWVGEEWPSITAARDHK